jgi:hypothetical protein
MSKGGKTPTSSMEFRTSVHEISVTDGISVRSEAVSCVPLPEFQPATLTAHDPVEVELDADVVKQIRLYITEIAQFYPNTNAFHNFEHASHVVMATIKLLQRVAMRDVNTKKDTNDDHVGENADDDYTLALRRDPLTKFAMAFSALIHDMDHGGVSNQQLVKEQDPLAVVYDGKSPMEQHSFILAFEILMEDGYEQLRACIYETQDEFDRFRQLCINCVMATDVFDKELQVIREDRWNKAFAEECVSGQSDHKDTAKYKATIAIEYIVQASDVSHTMQHWHVYQKWNKLLFVEMYGAYKVGRADKDPSEGWYQGELWFFDNYVIPLAEKLKMCEVFGVGYDQLLEIATENRKEWATKGETIVQTWVKEQNQGMVGSATE